MPPNPAETRPPPRGARPRRTPGRTLALVTLLAVGVGACSKKREIQPPTEGVPQIRVLLFDKLEEADISIDGPYQILLVGETETPRRLTAGRELDSTTVAAEGADLLVEGVVRTPLPVDFVPESHPVEINGQIYRGSLRVIPSRNRLLVLNLVDLEGYLRGVLPVEVMASWPEEALKAQAIAARSYVLVKAAERKDRPFDVSPTTADQMYRGRAVEHERTDAAVRATLGQVLLYDGRPFTTWYHSSCGGATADAEKVFAYRAPPLRGVECGYCTDVAKKKWPCRLSRSELARRVGQRRLARISVDDVDERDGRVGSVILHRADGARVAMAGTQFRSLTGVRSTRFTVELDGDTFVFRGSGWGHGVGMCQWGAKGMADAGRSAEEILAHYYPGARIVKKYGSP